MRYSAYLRGGQFLSLFNEQEAVWERLSECQRHLLLRALEADSNYQCMVAQYPRTMLIEIPLDVLPWEAVQAS
jgi:hypothetical protein